MSDGVSSLAKVSICVFIVCVFVIASSIVSDIRVNGNSLILCKF